MRPLRVLCVDDEPLGRDCVRLALAGVADAVLVGECGDGEEAVRVIREVRPDLVYLDVQMPGLGGFEVLEALGSAQPEVIFLTAYEEYALRAFAVHALDYLLKPFSNERFRESLAHAGRRIRAQEEPRTRASWLTVLQGEGRRLLKLSEVDYFAAEGNYVRVHVGAEAHLVRSTLAALLTRLDPARFVRIHRGVVVNLSRVKEVAPWGGGDYVATLHDGRQLRVSRHFKAALLRPFL